MTIGVTAKTTREFGNLTMRHPKGKNLLDGLITKCLTGPVRVPTVHQLRLKDPADDQLKPLISTDKWLAVIEADNPGLHIRFVNSTQNVLVLAQDEETLLRCLDERFTPQEEKLEEELV